MELTKEQIDAIEQGRPVRIPFTLIGEDLVVLRASRFEELQDLLEDEHEKRAWASAACDAARRWAQENPY